MCESGKKASSLDNEIEGIHRELAIMKKKKTTFSEYRNMDVRSMVEKSLVLTRERDRLEQEFEKAVLEAGLIVKSFNQVKKSLVHMVNGASLNIDKKAKNSMANFSVWMIEFMDSAEMLRRHKEMDNFQPMLNRNIDIQMIEDASLFLDSPDDKQSRPERKISGPLDQMMFFKKPLDDSLSPTAAELELRKLREEEITEDPSPRMVKYHYSR